MRLFVAVRPPDAILDVVASLRRPERPDVRWTTRPEWHITLRFLGEVADPGPVVAALDAAPLIPCVAHLGPEVTCLGRGVVVVPVGGIEALAGAVVTATARVGRPPEPRAFSGHLTLARARRGSVHDLVGERIDLRFPVADVRLVRSHLDRSGARYEDLRAWPLDRGTAHPEGA